MNRIAGFLSSVGPHVPIQGRAGSRDIMNNNNNQPMYSMNGPNGFEVFIPSPTRQQECDPAASFVRREGRTIRNNFGNYRPLLGGRIVLGPEWKLFFLHSFAFLFVLLFILLEYKDIWEQFGLSVLILGVVLHLTSICIFTGISFRDPGVVPLNYNMSELIRDTDEYRQRNPSERFYRYCGKCDGYRPPLCFHCNNCNICIRSQEVHMIAGGICVGERTSCSFLFMTFLMGALSWYLVIINSLLIVQIRKYSLEREEPLNIEKLVLASLSMISGIVLLCLPQVGVLMFLFRIYYIGNGYTTRSFVNAARPDELECPEDNRSVCQNFASFFFAKARPSAFRKRFNQVGPEYGPLEDQWLSTNLRRTTDSLDIIQLVNNLVDSNANRLSTIQNEAGRIEAEEGILLRALAAGARHKSTPSVPHLDNGLEQVAGCRLKTPLKSKPCEMLQLQINEFQKSKELPKSTISYRKHHEAPSTLSEGCIPRTPPSGAGGGQELLQLARAEQFRRIIHLVLLRDREGLIRLSRRINIAGLLGLEHFDPDNLQFVELSNGLPMLAPRRRDIGGPQNFHRFGGLLGIPQMVAAGLLPTARQMASDVENRLGPGTIVTRVVTTPPLRDGHNNNAIRSRQNQNQVQAHITVNQQQSFQNAPAMPNNVSCNNRQEERLNRILQAQRRLQRAAMQRELDANNNSAHNNNNLYNNSATMTGNSGPSGFIPPAPPFCPRPPVSHLPRRTSTRVFGTLTRNNSNATTTNNNTNNSGQVNGIRNDDEEQQLVVVLNDGQLFRRQQRQSDDANEI